LLSSLQTDFAAKNEKESDEKRKKKDEGKEEYDSGIKGANQERKL